MKNTSFLTDHYELTMLQAALHSGHAHKKAIFELFTRRLPKGRTYGTLAGTGRIKEALNNFTFNPDQLSWLKQQNIINTQTYEYLKNYKFRGLIKGLHEGDLYFPHTPILTVEGTFGECVLIETLLLSTLNYDSAVASAATRMVQAAGNTPLYELGSRRTNEQAAISAARATYIAGFQATSNLQAGYQYDIPTMGTSAHAYTLAHETETEAFKNQTEALGNNTTLLVDTYNIQEGITNAINTAGKTLGGIRIDSGDLYQETLNAREQLNEAGLHNTKIILSSDIDEYVIDELAERNIPVDGIGAGTKVVTGSGHPTAGMVYKLVAIEHSKGTLTPVHKKAENKISTGGNKHITGREYTPTTITEHITLTNTLTTTGAGNNINDYVYAQDGEYYAPTIEEARETHKQKIGQLPKELRRIQAATIKHETLYTEN